MSRDVVSCVAGEMLSGHQPAVPDRCSVSRSSRSSAGALDRISRPLILNAVPCRLGRRLPFVYCLLLTRTSYRHVVSWGSCHGEQTPDYTVLIPTTHFTPINKTRNLLPKDVLIVMAAKINLMMNKHI